MPVTLHVDPKQNGMSWKEFLATKPPFSIALDGYVEDAPRYQTKGPYLNLNHHEKVSRMETRATCAQARIHVEQGLFTRFQQDGEPHAHVWVNDCDQDVCFAWAILNNPKRLLGHSFPECVDAVDRLDTCGGFTRTFCRKNELAWIFEPYDLFRTSGELSKRDPEQFRKVIKEVVERVDSVQKDEGSPWVGHKMRDAYEIIRTGTGWILVKEESTNARGVMYQDGHRAFVAMTERPDGAWQYSVGRASPLVPFPVPQILKALARAEHDPKHTWGGSDLIGGCNRVHGSTLCPEEVAGTVENTIKKFLRRCK